MVIILLISTLFYFHFYACYDKRNNKRGLRFSMYDGITMDGSMQLLLFAFSAFDDWDIHRLSDSLFHLLPLHLHNFTPTTYL